MEANWGGPSGWPVIDDGLLMAVVEDVMFVRMAPRIAESVFDRQLKELARAIDERPIGVKVGVVYDALDGMDSSAGRRQRSADLLAARHAKLAATTAGFALVTDSAVMRGVLRAVFWMAPPPYPWTIAPDLRAGLAFIRANMPRLDVERALRAYERMRSGPASDTRPAGAAARKVS
jgi:hypothetical protein